SLDDSSTMPDDALRLAVPVLPAAAAHVHGCVTLADVPKGARAHVRGIRTIAAAEGDQLARRLQEIGFSEGECLRVVAHGLPRGEPIAVRVGGTTFALRRFEAQRVLVTLDPSH